ncbi:MAG: hypothetical protein KatS3mg035_0801 [Bacteroidia bacterium]|nr:MAG: hypothetical protein KatS3mg035_0801 [Bacteroidia bacterium]
MIFLQPWILFFLLFLLVPIIVHLFNFQKPKKLLFSNIQFVKEVDKVVTQRIKLKQWLLLIARLLAVVSLVLAFASPVMKNNSHPTAVSGNRSVIILIDNSMSMSASNPKGIYLDQAKFLAREIIKSYEPTDEFQIQTTGKLRLNAGFIRQNEALERIQEIHFQQNSLSYKKLVETLPFLFQNASSANRSIYVLSDFQKSTFFSEITEKKWSEEYKVHFVPLSYQTFKNVFISEIQPESYIFEKGKPLTFQLKIHNLSDEKIPKLSIQTEVNGKIVALSSESLEPNEIKNTLITYTVQETGWQQAKIFIEDYPIQFDNARYFSYYVAEKHPILCVKGTENSFYLDKFLQEVATNFQVKNVNTLELSNEDLKNYEVLILAGIKELSNGNANKISEWVKQGGGLLVFPHEESHIKDIQNLYDQLKIGQWKNLEILTQKVSMESPDVNMPFFKDIFLPIPKNAELESPNFQKIYSFMPNKESIYQNVLKLNNQEPLLVQNRVGSGWVFTYTFFPSLQWSDIVTHSLFAPLIYKSLWLASNAQRWFLQMPIGESEIFKMPSLSKSLVKLKKDNKEWIPEQYPQSGVLSLNFNKLELEPGNYQVFQGDSLFACIGFNLPISESDLTPAQADFLNQNGLVLDTNTNVLAQSIQQSEQGIPLWKYFVLFCLLMLVAELFILKFIQ